MKIHQAFFGDKNGSHNLIASSIENKSVIGHLKLNTDIPASISTLEGYLSGFRIDEYYVLTKTINDTESERPGMGFSHCLIIPIDSLELINNLRDIIGLFINVPLKQPSQLSDLELSPTPFDSSPNVLNYEEMIFQLSENKDTVVYLGYDHFESDMVKAWSVMSPILRANLAFTISGSPNEIENEQITIIHTPESYEPRWSKFPMVKNKPIDAKDRETIEFLIEPAAKESIEFYEFINVNAISFEYFHQYPAIAKLFRLSKKAIAAPETMLLKRVISAITEIIPLPENGAQLKKQYLTYLSKALN